jgi:hypothetical protein
MQFLLLPLAGKQTVFWELPEQQGVAHQLLTG